ncbi:MAG: cation-transporting P-type ATPase, partial [Clostridia bacterium]|nr:cation-transporting P-type ATPase [Deltaproteobacteria bacterium]
GILSADQSPDGVIHARATPEAKLTIVRSWKQQGAVVAMTGDGVNDAPALRQADIGIAMGVRGTEIAKESADMIITDDNFATIVAAVEQGRIVVQNTMRFIHYLFSSNFSEIFLVFSTIALGWPLPLGVLQILWVNLITDIFPAMALALEPSAPDVMTQMPRDPKAPIMTWQFGWLLAWQGLVLAGCALGAFAIGMRWYGREGPGLPHAITIAFMTLALTQVFHAFNARSRTRSLFASKSRTNPWLWGSTALCMGLQVAAVTIPALRSVLHTTPLTLADCLLIASAASVPMIVIELVKLTRHLRARDLIAAPSI